jgi:hypothetical protein
VISIQRCVYIRSTKVRLHCAYNGDKNLSEFQLFVCTRTSLLTMDGQHAVSSQYPSVGGNNGVSDYGNVGVLDRAVSEHRSPNDMHTVYRPPIAGMYKKLAGQSNPERF